MMAASSRSPAQATTSAAVGPCRPMRISSGPSSRNEKPRAASSSCIDETPRSNTTPSTVRRRRAIPGWIAGPRPNRDGRAPVQRDQRRARSRFDRGRPRRPVRQACPKSRAYSRRRRMSRRHKLRRRGPRATPPRDGQEPGYDEPIRRQRFRRRRSLSSFPRPLQPCRQDAAFDVPKAGGIFQQPDPSRSSPHERADDPASDNRLCACRLGPTTASPSCTPGISAAFTNTSAIMGIMGVDQPAQRSAAPLQSRLMRGKLKERLKS